MCPVESRMDCWDPKWGPHKHFTGPSPCVVSWEAKSQQPADSRGLHEASYLAIQRCQDDKWATGIRLYEDKNLALKSDQSQECRQVSPTECERLLGSPARLTARRVSPETDERNLKRNIAVGNAFAVPIISRFRIAFGPNKSISQHLPVMDRLEHDTAIYP